MEEREVSIELLYKKMEGQLSASEEEWVNKWLNEAEHRAYFVYLQRFYPLQEKSEISGQELEEAWRMMQKRINANSAKRISRFRIVGAIAATIILLLGIWQLWETKLFRQNVLSHLEPISPGRPCAVLELADGRLFDVKEPNQGKEQMLAGEIHLDSGRLDYMKSDSSFLHVASFHKLSVPRGGEFQLILSDGTKVWLNAESYLKYPGIFGKDMREVYLEGEAYFEVAKDSLRPFIVHSGVQRITVLGTSFGITNYPQDPGLSATLVEGKVLAEYPGQQFRLEPGSRIYYDRRHRFARKETVDVREYVAWKDGKYVFYRKRLEDMLTTLSRWYNFEVFYQNPEAKEVLFSGELLRFTNFNDILGMIEKSSDVHFSVKQNVVMVTK